MTTLEIVLLAFSIGVVVALRLRRDTVIINNHAPKAEAYADAGQAAGGSGGVGLPIGRIIKAVFVLAMAGVVLAVVGQLLGELVSGVQNIADRIGAVSAPMPQAVPAAPAVPQVVPTVSEVEAAAAPIRESTWGKEALILGGIVVALIGAFAFLLRSQPAPQPSRPLPTGEPTSTPDAIPVDPDSLLGHAERERSRIGTHRRQDGER